MLVGEGRALRIAGVLLVAAAVVFVGGEAVAAAAWRSPGYSYLVNYISDLGVPGAAVHDGRVVDSPLASVMNAAFVLNGAFVAVAAVLALRPRGPGWGVLGLALLYGTGMVLIAVFHETPAWMSAAHTTGAALAILGGNAAAVLTGVVVRQRLGAVLAGLGVTGLAGAVALPVVASGYDGLVERVAVYPVSAAQLVLGAALLARARTH